MDLHSTTANMGVTLIVDNDEPFNLQLAAYLSYVNPSVKVYSSGNSGGVLIHCDLLLNLALLLRLALFLKVF